MLYLHRGTALVVLQHLCLKISGNEKLLLNSLLLEEFFMGENFFSRFLGPVIDKVLGLRCTSFGYQYGEIVD